MSSNPITRVQISTFDMPAQKEKKVKIFGITLEAKMKFDWCKFRNKAKYVNYEFGCTIISELTKEWSV